MANKFCTHCGAALTPEHRFCPSCGQPTGVASEASEPTQPAVPPTPEGVEPPSAPSEEPPAPPAEHPTYVSPPPGPPPAPPPSPPGRQEPIRLQPSAPAPPMGATPAGAAGAPFASGGMPAEPPKKRRTGLWIALGCLGVLLLGCGAVMIISLVRGGLDFGTRWEKEFGLGGDVRESIEALATEAANAGSSVDVDEGDLPEPIVADGTQLYADDFSSASSGWDQMAEAEATLDYVNGQYEVMVQVAELIVWSLANTGGFDDGIISVDTRQLGGPDDNGYGLVFRYADQDNFYRFDISGDGYYRLGYFEGDVWNELIPWTETSLVNQGNAANQIAVRCEGESLTLYINGAEVDNSYDGTILYGDVGVAVETLAEPGAYVAFDNMTVRALD